MSNGGLIGLKNTPSASSAGGVWNIREQLRSKRDGIWPAGAFQIQYTSLLGDNGSWSGAGQLVLDTHDQYTITTDQDINLSIKMWGAGGACGFDYTQNISSTAKEGPGGAGGYTTANLLLRAGDTYYFQIGEGGIRTQTISTGATYEAGGVRESSQGGTEGGGYSGIFKNTINQAGALLIAGGGGGGADNSFGIAGAGGGSSGQNATELTGLNQGGEGGTQVAGGAPSVYNNATAGSALTGGLGQNNQSSLGGGGGGYFGGGGGNVGGGGGGSGFVSSDTDVTSGTTTAGSGSTPANNSDTDRGTAGQGGVSGSTAGTNGKIVISVV